MKKIDWNARISGIAEGLRTVIISVLAWLLTEGVIDALVTWFGGMLDVTQKMLIIGFLTSFGKGLDKWLNKKGIETPLDLKALDTLKK